MASLSAAAAAPAFLVADVGGTNCRLALARSSGGAVALTQVQAYRCADFPSAEQAIGHYLATLGLETPIEVAVLAIAGAVRHGEVKVTNSGWRLSETGLAGRAGRRVRLINDFTALALAAERLGEGDLLRIGPDVPGEPCDPVAVIGAGTGFGAGALMKGVGGSAAIATEGGHSAFAPTDDVEIEILRILARRFGRVSIERVLSGPGLVNLWLALAEIEGAPGDAPKPEDIVHAGLAGDPRCRGVLDRFCAIYGSVAGDFALTYGARGGVFIAGGIAPAIAGHLQASAFRDRFEHKGRFQSYVAAIPTRIVVNPHAGLIGCAWLASSIAAAEL